MNEIHVSVTVTDILTFCACAHIHPDTTLFMATFTAIASGIGSLYIAAANYHIEAFLDVGGITFAPRAHR